jgi:hypothetical protein
MGRKRMRRKDVALTSPVRRGVDTWQRLIHTLREAGSGKFLVTIHNGEVVKVAAVDREVKISEMTHPEDKLPGP